jgi:DNA-binding XRE family transcriptional regulator
VRLNISGSARRETAPSLPLQDARRGPPAPYLRSGTRGGPSIYGGASSRIWSSITFQSGVTDHQSNFSKHVRLLVGRNVKRLRIAAGLTQAALAERMGVDRAYVSGLELGQRNPTIVTLWHITKALEVTLKMFFDEDKPRRRVSRGKN